MHNGLEQLTAYVTIHTYIPTHRLIYTQIQAHPDVKALFYRPEASGCTAKRRTEAGGRKDCGAIGDVTRERFLLITTSAVSEQQRR